MAAMSMKSIRYRILCLTKLILLHHLYFHSTKSQRWTAYLQAIIIGLPVLISYSNTKLHCEE